MTWQTEITPIVRYLVNDVGSGVYSDNRLQETIVIAAQLMVYDVNFDKDYTISVNNGTISPDPTDETRDDAFINLAAMKASCIILQGEIGTKANQAFKITDGPSTIDTGQSVLFTQKRLDDICGKYEKYRKQYLLGTAKNSACVIGPYTNESVDIIPWNF